MRLCLRTAPCGVGTGFHLSAGLASSSVQPFPGHAVTVGLLITDGEGKMSSLACPLWQNIALSRATQRNSQT